MHKESNHDSSYDFSLLLFDCLFCEHQSLYQPIRKVTDARFYTIIFILLQLSDTKLILKLSMKYNNDNNDNNNNNTLLSVLLVVVVASRRRRLWWWWWWCRWW